MKTADIQVLPLYQSLEVAGRCGLDKLYIVSRNAKQTYMISFPLFSLSLHLLAKFLAQEVQHMHYLQQLQAAKASSVSAVTSASITKPATSSQKFTIKSWLELTLPGASASDVDAYSAILSRDGFDSPDMVALLEPADLSDFKKAHARAIMLTVAQQRTSAPT
jgi:hypothetical protein